MAMPCLREFAPALFVSEGAVVSFYGFPYPTRMAVIMLSGGGLFIWSPGASRPRSKARSMLWAGTLCGGWIKSSPGRSNACSLRMASRQQQMVAPSCTTPSPGWSAAKIVLVPPVRSRTLHIAPNQGAPAQSDRDFRVNW